MEWYDIVTTIGFPIAACGAMGWFVKYTTDNNRQDRKESEEAHKQAFDKITEAINNNTMVITKLVERLKGDEDDIK